MTMRCLFCRFTKVVVTCFLLMAATRLTPPPLHAKDGTGLDKITWSGTIRIERQLHAQSNSHDDSIGETTSSKRDVVVVSEYHVEGLPHDQELTWRSADVQVQVRGNETSSSERVWKQGAAHSESYNAGKKEGSGNTTAGLTLILRGEGDSDVGHCWVEMGPIGERDDGGQLTKPIELKGTSHNWGEARPDPRSCIGSKTCGQKWNVTNNVTEQLHPGSARLEVPCDKDARSLHGSKMLYENKDGFERINYDLSQDGEARTEVELIPPDGYEQWLPQAGETEKALGNYIDVGIVAHTKGDPSLAPPKKVKKYKITLADTSRELGVDSNWPQQATDAFDMKIDKDNPWIKLTDGEDSAQSAETKEEGLTEFRVTVNSYDWGGYTKLKVIAELEDGTSVVAHVRGHSDQDTLAIPKDENANHIADWWEHWFELENTDAAADDDGTPLGDSHKGDSIALYDEYRGFHITGKHERLSPELKDLFIWDLDHLGAGVYAGASSVTVHLISADEIKVRGGAPNTKVITPNGSHGDAYALYLVDEAIEAGVVGDTDGGPSVPRNIKRVTINSKLIAAGYGDTGAAALQSAIAHELGHATNVWHHGDDVDYNTGDARCLQPDGTYQNYLCSTWPKGKNGKPTGPGTAANDCFEVAVKGGMYSGNDQCIMRYDMTNFYENPKGNCQWQRNGKTVIGSLYGKDPPGMSMCESKKGTGVNDASNPNNKAGDATRGECRHNFCLKNSAH